MTSARFRRRTPRLACLAATSSLLLSACSKDESTLPTLGPRVAPAEVAVSSVEAGAVDIAWRQEQGNPTGYEIQRSVGAPGTNVTTFTIDAPASHFVDTTAPGAATLYYSVRAQYGGAISAARTAEPLNLSYLPPTLAFAALEEDGVIRLNWTAPDKTQQLYDSFYILRFLDDDELVPDGVFPDPLPETEFDLTWHDRALPIADEVGQRLQYGVSTELDGVLSRPAPVTPSFQWTYPTVPIGVQIGGARDHVLADAEFDATELAVVLTNTDQTGTVQTRVLDTNLEGLAIAVAFSIESADGEAEGVVVGDRIAVSHRADGATDMTVTTYDRSSSSMLTSATFSPGVAGIWKGPEPDDVSVIENGDVVVLDPETLAETDRHVVTGDALAAHYTSPTVLLTLERHGSTDLRLSRRNILSDTFSWQSDVIGGTALRNGAIKVAPDGSVAAITTMDGATTFTTIVDLGNGDILGSVEGVAMSFVDQGLHLAVGSDDALRTVESVRTTDATTTETFAGFDVSAAYADGTGNFVTIDRNGTIQTYLVTRDWWPAFDDDPELRRRFVTAPVEVLPDHTKGT